MTEKKRQGGRARSASAAFNLGIGPRLIGTAKERMIIAYYVRLKCRKKRCARGRAATNLLKMWLGWALPASHTTPAQREIYNPRHEGATRTARGGGNRTCEKCVRERTATKFVLSGCHGHHLRHATPAQKRKKWRKCNDKSCGSYDQSGCDGHCFNQHVMPCTEGGKNNRKRRAAKK
jgi:hypothetical protein